MTKTTQCELRRLGEDAPIHEELQALINAQNDRMPHFSCGQSRFENRVMQDIAHNNVMYLRELIEIRKKHDLPNDGKCYKCPGDKCSGL